MTAVQPGNLKLIGRATYLLQSHVNSVLASDAWRKQYGKTEALSYAEANAMLFAAIEQRKTLPEAANTPEVELAIVATLERLASQRPLDWKHAALRLQAEGLNGYLRRFME